MSDRNELYTQLQAARQANQRGEERTLLNELGNACFSAGDYRDACTYFEQKLVLDREQHDRASEVATLNTIALVCDALGETRQALYILQQTLPVVREIDDRNGEATTLNDIALVYQDMGEPQRALAFFQQALTIRREINDVVGEATTINNIAGIYHAIGDPYRALALYRQALPLFQQLEHHTGEAATMNNMALVYRNIGEAQRALELLQQALPMRRALGERADEADTLNCLASVLLDMQQYDEALDAFEQSIALERAVQHHAGESASLVGAARLLYRHLARRDDAIAYMQQAIAVLENAGITRDAAGHTIDVLQQVVEKMTQRDDMAMGSDAETMSTVQIQQVVGNTIAVMTVAQDQRAEWRAAMEGALRHAQQQDHNWQSEVELFQAVLALLDEKKIHLPEDHTYAAPIREMQRGIKAGRAKVVVDNNGLGTLSDEVATLTNIAKMQQENGKPHQALDVFQQALNLCRTNNDGIAEAATLTNMAELYHTIGNSEQALDCYQQAWNRYQQHKHHTGEIATCNNMALVYRTIGQPHRALEVLQQALPICKETDDHAGEAGVLINQAAVLLELGRYSDALHAFEQSATLQHELGNPAGESAGLIGAARIRYRHLNQRAEALQLMNNAIDVLDASGLSQDTAGHTTAMLKHLVASLHQTSLPGFAPSEQEGIAPDQLQHLVSNTIAVLTLAQDSHSEWYDTIKHAQQHAVDNQNYAEAELFQAIRAILDGKRQSLPPYHPYSTTVTDILNSIQIGEFRVELVADEVKQAFYDLLNAEGIEAQVQVIAAQQLLLFRPDVDTLFEQHMQQAQAHNDTPLYNRLDALHSLVSQCTTHGVQHTIATVKTTAPGELPFEPELVQRTIAAFQGNAKDRLEHTHYLTHHAANSTDEHLKELINTIQMAMLGAEKTTLGTNLSGAYLHAWQSIVASIVASVDTVS